MIYLELFLSFLQIGLFSFGGGYAAMPLIQGQVVNGHHWLSMTEFTDLITISQMTPGPIAVNSATFVGIRIAGIPGALAATLGCILPSCLIVTLIASFYLKYRNLSIFQSVLATLRPAVVAMIAAAGVSILTTAFWGSKTAITLRSTHWSLVFIFIISAVLLQKYSGHDSGRNHEYRTLIYTRNVIMKLIAKYYINNYKIYSENSQLISQVQKNLTHAV